MKWLEETHGRQFELVRHFLRRMFDGEWSSGPGQWRSAAIGAVSLFLPAGLLLVREGALDPKYASKYRLLEMAAGADAVRPAAIADELALMTLLMSVTGLIALLVWQSLFPSGRDYLVLASLPVRPGQVFTARFTSVLLFSAAIVAAMNFLPSLIAPIEFGGGWRIDSSYAHQASAQALASCAACFFVFFAILSLQGVLLNIAPPSLFTRLSVYAQGALAGLFLLAGFYSWSIKEWKPELVAKMPEFGAWLPPVWFTGLHRTLGGDGDPFFAAMAGRAGTAAVFAVTLAAGAYLISYRRYRKLLIEAPVRLSTPRIWRWSALRLLARSPRREAVMDFMAKTLIRSRTHRLLWLVYLGAAGAVLLNSSLIDGAIFMRSGGAKPALKFMVHFWPLACSVVVLNGFRHVLSIPAELRANWIFQMTESQGRAEWMSAVERFTMAYGVAPIYLALFPVAGVVLGWPMAIRLTVLQLLVSLSIFEALFYSWQKLPFTCSHVPGERPLIGVVGKYMAMLCVVTPMVSVMIGVASQVPFLFVFYLAIFGSLWIWLRRRRREGWGEAKLMYEDLPAVAADLGIKELTYAGTEAQRRRDAAGDAGHARSEGPDPRADARLRRDGVHSPDVGGCTASGGGGPVSGAPSHGTARPAGVGVGRFGEQSEGQVLPAHDGGTQSPGERGGSLAKGDGRYRPDHGPGLTATPVGAFLTAAWLRLRTAFRRRQLDQDLEDELQFHLAMREERMEGTGADVPFRARQKFGNVTAVKETCRELWTFGWIEAIWQDVRYGLRQLRVNRGFTAAAILTLSLGIAATATIYAVCAALVWQKLPLPEADRLAVVLQALPGNSHLWIPSSPGDVEDIRKGSTVLESLASWENATAKIVDVDGEPVRVDQARVTANFFDVLGVAPRFGRSFSPGADQPGRESEVVLSDGLWRRRFRADRRVIGTSIRLNDRNYTVIGVMPAGFAFPRASKELWTPLALTPGERVSRNTPRLDSVARLKPGRTLREAQAELDGVSRRLEMAYPQTNTKRRFSAWTAQRYVTGDYAAQFARLLLGAAIFVLLIACVNVANLQFARGTSRTREVAIRQALGASRWRIVAQLLTESLVIAAAGAGLGIAMANFGLRAIRNGMPQELQRYSSGWANLDINAEVLAFALAAAALSGILAGFAPALRSSRPNLVESLKEGVQSSAGLGRRRARSALLAAEIALTVVLLAGAGLMVRGFHKLMSGKTGFEPAAVLSLRVEVDAESHRTPEQVSAFYADVLERIAALPGVQTTAAASSLPFSRHAQFSAFTIRDREAQAGAPATAQFERVSPGYFSTMRIPLRAGRLLSSRDGPHAPLSVVISEEMARQWWPGEAFPIGKQIRIAALNSRADMATIVGVVGGVKASVLDRTPGPVLYLSCEQAPAEGMDIAVRAAGDPLSLATPVRLAVKAVDPGQPATDITTLERMRQNEVIGLTYAALLMSIFGGVALAMSWVGVYGMTAYLVLRQTHEIGIRMALGASPRAVLRGVFGRSARPVFAGIALGVLLSLGVARALAAVIWGVSATDPGTFAGVPALLAVAVGFAIYVPARRILNTNPMTALRSE